MALIPTLLALAVGVGLGLRWGGNFGNVMDWRPDGWMIGLGGVTVWLVADVTGLFGTPAVLLRLLGLGLVLAFAVLNIHTGGMVLVAAGVGLSLVVTLINWGMPVAESALTASGIVEDSADIDSMVLTGGREVADGALLGFFGDVIPLPWGQVISIGDVLWLCGLALVTASVMRRYQARRPGRGGGRGSYSDSLTALGQGPAPRRGPGLHPSRLGSRGPGRATR
ncbi:MAG: DUF5317 domain-containing protein [Actinomycetia bacterium]|nr:DUF5317 domain-containing protein [Actinomycetes bacterium]